MPKLLTCITFVIVACLWYAHTATGTPANPVFTRDTSTGSRTLGHDTAYGSFFNTDYNARLASLIADAKSVHDAFQSFTVSVGQSRAQWVAANSHALINIYSKWPPSQSDCRFLCGEVVAGRDGTKYRTGTCQIYILEEHRKFFRQLAGEAYGKTETQSLAWRSAWFNDPSESWPPYWTFTHTINQPPVYMLNGFCSCRPGWGMSQDLENALWTGLSPFNGPTLSEPSNPWVSGVYQTVNYTGQGRVLLSTLITIDNFHDYRDAASSNVVLGFKAPMACEIEIDQPIRPLSQGGKPLDMRIATHIRDIYKYSSSTCADPHSVGKGIVNLVALKCLLRLWEDSPMKLSPSNYLGTDRYVINVNGFPGHRFQSCLPFYADLNTQGWCKCSPGYGDTNHIWGPLNEGLVLERPYHPEYLVTSADEQTAVRDTLYDGGLAGCDSYDKYFCALSALMTYPGLPRITGIRIGSPRCEDYRACNMRGVPDQKGRHTILPYRVKATLRGFLLGQPHPNTTPAPGGWQPKDIIEMYNQNWDLLYMSKQVTHPRTCHTYVCTAPSHGTAHLDPDTGIFSCTCKGRWTGDWCEIDGNAIFCKDHGEYNHITGLCACVDDWTTVAIVARNTQCNVHCGVVYCSGHGDCTDLNHACECDAQHDGADCQQLCGALHCNGHGTCTSPWVEGTSVCTGCDAGFTGVHCHLNLRWLRCSGHGDPVDTGLGGYTEFEDGCLCDEHFYGTDCSLNIDSSDFTCINELGDSEYNVEHSATVHRSYGARRVFDHYPAFGQDDV